MHVSFFLHIQEMVTPPGFPTKTWREIVFVCTMLFFKLFFSHHSSVETLGTKISVAWFVLSFRIGSCFMFYPSRLWGYFVITSPCSHSPEMYPYVLHLCVSLAGTWRNFLWLQHTQAIEDRYLSMSPQPDTFFVSTFITEVSFLNFCFHSWHGYRVTVKCLCPASNGCLPHVMLKGSVYLLLRVRRRHGLTVSSSVPCKRSLWESQFVYSSWFSLQV